MTRETREELENLAICYLLACEFGAVPNSSECKDGHVRAIFPAVPLYWNRIRNLDKYLGLHPEQIADRIVTLILAK